MKVSQRPAPVRQQGPASPGPAAAPAARASTDLRPRPAQDAVEQRARGASLAPTPRHPEHDGSGGAAPAWAEPAYFRDVAARAGSAGALPTAGSSLSVRTRALAAQRPATSASADREARTERGRSLLARAGRALGVIGGVPMSADDIARTKTAVHLTRSEAVEPILAEGLRPTVGVYKNLTSWCRDAVYMFPRPPGALQRAVNFAEQMNAATEMIEVDLTRLDPDRLYRRVLDGALMYISSEPIPPAAVRHLGTLEDAPADGRP